MDRVDARRGAATDIPPGWTYNPSAWSERRLLIGMAAIGFIAALYTALSQLGLFPTMWDPLFGSASSYAVTHSAVSQLLPVPDGLLGVAGYTCDLVFGSIGGDDRWLARPWVVLVFAVVITGLGLVSLALTILQSTLIGHWCTVCLVSAAVSTLIFGLGIGEVLPTLQQLARVHGERGWAAVWRALCGHHRAREHEERRPTSGVAAKG